MPKFNFRKSILNPLKTAASPYINQALGELKTKGMDALKQMTTQGLAQLEQQPYQLLKLAV